MPVATEERDVAQIRELMATFERCVNATDYETAKRHLTDDVISYGSKGRVMVGFQETLEGQWQFVWPKTAGFRFVTNERTSRIAVDGDTAWVACEYAAQTVTAGTDPVPRGGRVTMIFERQADGSWLQSHAHFSVSHGSD